MQMQIQVQRDVDLDVDVDVVDVVGRRAGEEEEAGGVQEKQEPHTQDMGNNCSRCSRQLQKTYVIDVEADVDVVDIVHVDVGCRSRCKGRCT